MSIFKVTPENRNLDYYLEMYNSKFVSNDSLEIIQLYYYLYENIDVYTGELYILEKHKPDLDGFCKRGGRSNSPLFSAISGNIKKFRLSQTRQQMEEIPTATYYNTYARNTNTDEKGFYNPITLLENDPKIYIADSFGKDIMKMRSIIWGDTIIDGVGNNINFNMLMLAYKLGDIKHLLSPIKGITIL